MRRTFSLPSTSDPRSESCDRGLWGRRVLGTGGVPRWLLPLVMWPSHPHHRQSPFWKLTDSSCCRWSRLGEGGSRGDRCRSRRFCGSVGEHGWWKAGKRRAREREIGILRHGEKCEGSGEERNWDYGREGRRLWGRACRRGRWSPGRWERKRASVCTSSFVSHFSSATVPRFSFMKLSWHTPCLLPRPSFCSVWSLIPGFISNAVKSSCI